MLNKIQNDWRRRLIFYSMFAMLIGLFASRAVLSIAMITFILVAFAHRNYRFHFRNFFFTPLLWGMSLLFVLPLISGAWSEDQETWMDILRIKLPLLLLPLAFAAPMHIREKDWKTFAVIFLLVVTAASLWSSWLYFSDLQAIHEGYLRSNMISTPLGNDHVRFSWLVSIAILVAVWMRFRKTGSFSGWKGNALLITALWLLIYLHILAARTGLLCFYLMLFVTAAWMMITQAKPLRSLIVLLILMALPVVAFFSFPTFQNRVRYFVYDLSYFKDAKYLPGSNDGVRVLSFRAGWALVKEEPLKGVGFGDIKKASIGWYDRTQPGMLETDKIYPSSEWLVYGAGCGWPGIIIFTVVMLIPFFMKRMRNRLSWYLLNLSVFVGFIFDIGIEVQYGVFVYAFMVLWFWKWNGRPMKISYVKPAEVLRAGRT